MEFFSRNEAETEAIGAELAGVLAGGSVVAFRGGLGMGKTAFTRGLARGLGFPGRVTSPTFTVVNEYEGGRLPLFHFDLYRLADAEELFAIGWDEYLDRGGVCVVEWSEQAPDALPPDTVFVTITRAADRDSNARAADNNSQQMAEREQAADSCRQIRVDGLAYGK